MRFFGLYAMLIYVVMFGLEYILAKLPQRWPGLLLPAAALLLSIVRARGGTLGDLLGGNVLTVILLFMYFLLRRNGARE